MCKSSHISPFFQSFNRFYGSIAKSAENIWRFVFGMLIFALANWKRRGIGPAVVIKFSNIN